MKYHCINVRGRIPDKHERYVSNLAKCVFIESHKDSGHDYKKIMKHCKKVIQKLEHSDERFVKKLVKFLKRTIEKINNL